MPNQTIDVTLVGQDSDGGVVRLADFVKFMRDLGKCLKASEIALFQTPKAFTYDIIDSIDRTAQISLRAQKTEFAQRDADLRRFFLNTVSDLTAVGRFDARYRISDLKRFRELARPLKRRIKRIHLSDVEITSQYIANIDNLACSSLPASFGSLKGVVERVDIHHSKLEFHLHPLLDESVVCVFGNDLLDEVRSSLGRTVTVRGQILRRASGQPDRMIVDRIEIHPADEQLPTFASLRGIGKPA